MGFAPYEDVVPPIRLPYRGKEYELPRVGVVDAEVVDRAAADEVEVERPSDAEVERILLGAAGEQMRADNVPLEFQARAVKTALAEHRYGRTMAEAIWATNGRPDLLEKFLAEQVLEQAVPVITTAESPAKEPDSLS